MVTRGLADTSVFIAVESGRPINRAVIPDQLAVSIITIAELRMGILAAPDTETRSQRLATLTRAIELEPVDVTTVVAEAWAKLRIDLRSSGKKMPVNDSWIAATAIALGVPIVTQDNDYVEISGLDVIRA